MSEEMLTLEKRLVVALVEALEECSEDLEVEVKARYDGTLDYPVMLRRFTREMSPVAKAKQALDEYRERTRV